MNTTGWLKDLQVTVDGTGIVSHAEVALVRALADNVGLTAGLSKALASRRLLVRDRGRVLADLACAAKRAWHHVWHSGRPVALSHCLFVARVLGQRPRP